MTKADYRREFEETFDFDGQIRTVCDLKTSVTIQEDIVFNDDGLIHVFNGLRRDPLSYYAEEAGVYCMIGIDVCLMACRGQIWVTYEMHLDDYEPTVDEMRTIKAVAVELGFTDTAAIEFHATEVSIPSRDSVPALEIVRPTRLH